MKITTRLLTLLTLIAVFISALSGVLVYAEGSKAPVTIIAKDTVVSPENDIASVKIILTDIGPNGCCACRFKVTVDNGALISDRVLSKMGGSQVCEIINGGKTASYMWVGGADGTVYDDTVILTVLVDVSNANGFVNVTVTPSPDPEDFLDRYEDIGLGGKGVNGSVTVVKSYNDAMRLSVADVTAFSADRTALVEVTLSNVSFFGASSCKFSVSVPGASITDYKSGDITGRTVFNQTEEGVAFLWVGDPSDAVYTDTVLALFTVTLPEGLKGGELFDVILTVDKDEDNYLSADGEKGLGAIGSNGSVRVVPSDSILICAPSVRAEIGSDAFSFDISVRNVPDLGLASCKFGVSIDGATPVSITPAELGGSVFTEVENNTAELFWVDVRGEGISSDTVIAAVTFRLDKGVTIGDELVINVIVDADPDMYLSHKDIDTGLYAYPINGAVTVVGHSLTHFELTKPHNGQNGWKEHWYCDVCGKCFLDEAGTVEADPANLVLLVGDVNEDGKVNAKDVVLLMRVVTGMRTADPAFADFNGDGKVNAKDVTLLMKHLTGRK